MASNNRTSDENLNPDSKDTVRTPKVIERKRLSTQERRRQLMFEKSGMKAGALFPFVTVTKKKKDDEGDPSSTQSQQPTTSTSPARVMTDIRNNRNGVSGAPVPGGNSPETNNNDVLENNAETGEEEGTMANSQDSSIIFEGEYDPNTNKNVELVEIRSRSDHDDEDSNAQEEGDESEGARLSSEKNSPTPPSDEFEDIQDNEVPSDPSPDNHQDYSTSSDDIEITRPRTHQQNSSTLASVNLPAFEPMSTCDKVQRWQMENKRVHEAVTEPPDEPFSPPPNKTSRRSASQTPSPLLGRREDAETGRSSSVSSYSGSPMMKITSVFSVAPATTTNENVSVTASSNEARASSSITEQRAKRFKESENREVRSFIEKRNWSKALKIMAQDFKLDKLPKPGFVGVLIRNAILCDGARVAKQVQSDSLEFLETLVQEFPPSHGNRSDVSVKYYKEIFENVFENSSTKNENKLYDFLMNICTRVEQENNLETNTLHLLVFVTNLVLKQFEAYENVNDKDIVKVKPPFFQHFFEDKEGRYYYDPRCRNIVTKLFTATATEMICIYLKWVNLIAKKFGSFSFSKKENQKLIEDVADKCRKRDDLGLFCFLNLEYHHFSTKVCQKMFEDLHITSKDGSLPTDVAEMTEIKIAYLKHLASTLLIKPAETVISDLYAQPCPKYEGLTLMKTRMERDLEPPEKELNSNRRKNVKGETQLHKLCSSNTTDTPLEELKKEILISPQSINYKDNYGNVPLHDCVVNDKGNIIVGLMRLHSHGKIPVEINFLARNKSLETPLHLAAVYCSPQNAEILKYFAAACGELDNVLTAPNGDGKLPFEVATNKQTKSKLKPEGYDVKSMLDYEGITVTPESADKIINSFAWRKVIAWWSKYCEL